MVRVEALRIIKLMFQKMQILLALAINVADSS